MFGLNYGSTRKGPGILPNDCEVNYSYVIGKVKVLTKARTNKLPLGPATTLK